MGDGVLMRCVDGPLAGEVRRIFGDGGAGWHVQLSSRGQAYVYRVQQPLYRIGVLVYADGVLPDDHAIDSDMAV
jgi:hypothetical protein